MLSLFPSLLSLNQYAPFVLRIVLGLVLLFWVYKSFKNPSLSSNMKVISVVEGIAGILLVIGLWTQAAALFVAIDLIVRLIERIQKKAFLTDGINYYLILLVIALSLIATGAGAIAFDLPL